MAPVTMTIVSEPKMSPTPLRMAPAMSPAGMPRANAAAAETSTNARNGCTFAQTTSATSVMIAMATMASGMGSVSFLNGDETSKGRKVWFKPGHARAKIASISTGTPAGSDPAPIALRAPTPRSGPQISAKSSLQPLIT